MHLKETSAEKPEFLATFTPRYMPSISEVSTNVMIRQKVV